MSGEEEQPRRVWWWYSTVLLSLTAVRIIKKLAADRLLVIQSLTAVLAPDYRVVLIAWQGPTSAKPVFCDVVDKDGHRLRMQTIVSFPKRR